MKLNTFNALELNEETLKDVTRSLDELGYVILKNAENADFIRRVADDLEHHFESRPNSQGSFWGRKTTRIEAVLSKSPKTHPLVLNKYVLSLVDYTLKPNCDLYCLNLTQGIRIYPGERAQVPHSDSDMFPVQNKPFDFMVNVIWALSDFSAENGGTILVPGSHNWEKGRLPQPSEMVKAEMQMGDLLFYKSSLIHSGGANTTELSRTGLAVSYCLGWLRQSENMYLTYPPDIARTFPKELQSLIGYNVHRPNLGWAFGKNPIELLSSDSGAIEMGGAEEFIAPEQEQLIEQFYLAFPDYGKSIE